MSLQFKNLPIKKGFPGSSASKESASNAGNPGLSCGSGRSAGEGTGYLLEYSWASLVTQTVRNLPAMWQTWVWSLSQEDPLEKGMANHSNILAWRILQTEEHGRLQSMGLQSQTWLSDFHFYCPIKKNLGSSHGFINKFCRTFKEKIQNLHRLLEKTDQEGHFSTYIMRSVLTWYQN